MEVTRIKILQDIQKQSFKPLEFSRKFPGKYRYWSVQITLKSPFQTFSWIFSEMFRIEFHKKSLQKRILGSCQTIIDVWCLKMFEAS